MEKYIITMEDGNNYIADTITQAEYDASDSGILTIIRVSDCKIHNLCEWHDMDKWPTQPEVNDVECNNCRWKGKRDDLKMDFYEEHESSMPIADICPNCKQQLG